MSQRVLVLLLLVFLAFWRSCCVTAALLWFRAVFLHQATSFVHFLWFLEELVEVKLSDDILLKMKPLTINYTFFCTTASILVTDEPRWRSKIQLCLYYPPLDVSWSLALLGRAPEWAAAWPEERCWPCICSEIIQINSRHAKDNYKH